MTARGAEGPIAAFRAKLGDIPDNLYPEWGRPVRPPVDGIAAFPAGSGLDGAVSFPYGGIMLIGKTPDTVANYRKRLDTGQAHGDDTNTMPFWRNVRRLLTSAGLARERCFFTNAYPCLELSPFKWPSDEFIEACQGLLTLQVEIMRPSLVIALGKWVPPFLAGMSTGLDDWAGSPPVTLLELDEKEQAVRPKVLVAGRTTTVVALYHPSARPHHRARRRNGTLTGEAAEVALLREVAKGAGPKG